MKKDLIKEELQELRKYSSSCEKKQKEYLSNKFVINKNNGETKELDYDLKKEYKLRYNDLISKSIYFQKEMERIYQNKFTALFITLTANTQYHKYKINRQDELVLNPKYKDFSINETYELLNSVKRSFYNEFTKADNGRVKLDFKYLQVVEKHISLTPHLHIILFVPNDNLEYALNIIKRRMKCTSEKRLIIDDEKKPINKYLINFDYKKNINNDIGRCEIEILKDSKKVTAYVSKYIKKQFKSDNIEYIQELDGWKRKNRITLVLTSRTPVPKYIYKTIFSNLKKEDKLKFEDLFCDIQNNTTLVKTDIKTGNSKTKSALNNEIFKAQIFKSSMEIEKKDVLNELNLIKKLSKRELQLLLTKQININLKIFNLFMSNTTIKSLKKMKINLMLDNFLVKKESICADEIYLDDKLADKYKKWLESLLSYLENINTSIKVSKIERLIINYLDNTIYDSDDWELIDYSNENKKIA